MAKVLTPQEELELIQKKLGHLSIDEKPVRYWLDTGSELLNKALGSPTLGIPYNKIIALDGFESHGKTALALELAARAQNDGADIGWLDPEDSFDARWAAKRGLDASRVVTFKTRLVKGEKKDEERLITAQELCSEAEAWIRYKHKQRPKGRIFLGVDSVTALLTEDESMGGIDNQNMRTGTSLASFLSKLLRRWTAVASSCNVMIVLINQVRMAPGVMFGNPEYNPGGKALGFYASVKARVRRAGGHNGRLLQDGRTIGIQGIITNQKNKVGEGSEEGHKVGFKTYWDKPGFNFMAADKIKKQEEEPK